MAAKVQAALEQALLQDTVLRETLVQVHGFTVQEVRLPNSQVRHSRMFFVRSAASIESCCVWPSRSGCHLTT